MSNSVSVDMKTTELTGAALDWAVAKTQEKVCPVVFSGKVYHDTGWDHIPYSPSTQWAQGGPLRDKYDVGIEPGVPDGLRYAYVPGRDLEGAFGETALFAICRAIVVAELGEVVKVPKELVEGVS